MTTTQGFGTKEEEEEDISLRIEKVIKKKSVSIVNPTLVLPALSFIRSRERGQFTIDTDFFFFDNFFDSEGNLFFFFLFCTKTHWTTIAKEKRFV